MHLENMRFIEKIKQHWKVILICLLTIMFMSKCSTSCSRGKEIEKQANMIAALDSTIIYKDSIIREMTFDLDMKNALLDSEKSHNNNFTSIASDNQAELMKKVYNLTEENTKLKEDNKRQKTLINALSKENEILKAQLDSTLIKNN